MATPWSGDVNALCWRRQLDGDFREIVDRLSTGAGMTTIADDELQTLTLSAMGERARSALLADQALLREHGLAPSLDCIGGYPRDVPISPIPTDVYSFHVDSATIPADTFLCTYVGSTSEGLANEMAIRRIDVAETRAELLKFFGGPDDETFAAFVREHGYDLHYASLPGAEPYAFGLGNLWRIAIVHPGAAVLPCIHRAPPTHADSPPRLLLIS